MSSQHYQLIRRLSLKFKPWFFSTKQAQKYIKPAQHPQEGDLRHDRFQTSPAPLAPAEWSHERQALQRTKTPLIVQFVCRLCRRPLKTQHRPLPKHRSHPQPLSKLLSPFLWIVFPVKSPVGGIGYWDPKTVWSHLFLPPPTSLLF
jgi:hypothetical protein